MTGTSAGPHNRNPGWALVPGGRCGVCPPAQQTTGTFSGFQAWHPRPPPMNSVQTWGHAVGQGVCVIEARPTKVSRAVKQCSPHTTWCSARWPATRALRHQTFADEP